MLRSFALEMFATVIALSYFNTVTQARFLWLTSQSRFPGIPEISFSSCIWVLHWLGLWTTELEGRESAVRRQVRRYRETPQWKKSVWIPREWFLWGKISCLPDGRFSQSLEWTLRWVNLAFQKPPWSLTALTPTVRFQWGKAAFFPWGLDLNGCILNKVIIDIKCVLKSFKDNS